MTILPEIWRRLLLFLTGSDKYKSQQHSAAAAYATEYADKSGINFLFIAANKLASYALTDSTINITSQNKQREKLLNAAAQKLWRNARLVTARALGCGKYGVFPYFNGNTIELDFVSQTQIYVLQMRGGTPVDIAVLCEIIEKNGTSFARFRRYTLTGTTHTISEIYSAGETIVEDSPLQEWQPAPPITIENVDRLLFGAVDCPTDPRGDGFFYRAKLTDGADEIIRTINEQLEYLEREYRLKESRIFVDSGALGVDKNGDRVLSSGNVYAMLDSGESMFEVFDPQIRADPIFTRLKFSLELLEKQIGVSSGVFTAAENLGNYANKSNIKRTVYDTYAMVTEIRMAIREAAADIIYAANALCDAYGLCPKSQPEYVLSIDWSNAMVEDMDTEWQQYKDLADRGGMTVEELRRWVVGQ